MTVAKRRDSGTSLRLTFLHGDHPMKLIFPFAVITLVSFAVGCSKSSSPKTDDSTPLAASAHTTNAVVAAADNADLFTCNASKGEGMCMQFDDLKLAEIG